MVQNKPQSNDDKIEILLTGSAPGIYLSSSLCVGQNGIPLFNVARNLGVIFDSQLALKKQVNKLCQLAYLEIRRIGSLRQYLPSEPTTTLVSSLALSRLDYCNVLLASSLHVLLNKSQRVISCSGRLICRTPKSAHIIPLLFDASTLSLVQLLHTSLNCFTSVLFLVLFAQPRILGYCVFLEWAGGPQRRDPFKTSDL